MGTEKNLCDVRRKFGYKEVVWEIENYIVQCGKKEWEIYSPEFNVTGCRVTRWRLFLKLAKSNIDVDYAVILIYLERLESDPFPGEVRVCWNMRHIVGERNQKLCEKEGVFLRKSRVSATINLQRFEAMLRISPKKLSFKCTILVYNVEDITLLSKSKDLGLKSLSENLLALYKLKHHSDITFYTDGFPLSCHKAILSVRSEVLNDTMKTINEDEDMYLNWYLRDATDSVFRYLYSGNLDYVLRLPSISLHETINFLDLKKLETFYLSDALTLRTEFHVKELTFKWAISNLKFRNENFLESIDFGKGSLNTMFRLRLNLHGTGDKTGYMGIFLEIVDGSRPKDLQVKYNVTNIFGITVVDERCMQWFPEEDGILGIEDFISRDILNNSFVNEGLCILCTLAIPTDSSSVSVVYSKSSRFNDVCHEEHYALLSAQIESLLETGIHSDLAITCGKEIFKTHKCILSARSPVLSENIKALKDQSTLSISDIDPDTLRITLCYIYSGVLKNCKASDAKKVYLAASRFSVLTLKNECSGILQQNIQPLNVLETLFLANGQKDLKLKKSVFKFVIHNTRESQQQGYWGRLIHENPSLYEEFKKYTESYIKSYPHQALQLAFEAETNLKR